MALSEDVRLICGTAVKKVGPYWLTGLYKMVACNNTGLNSIGHNLFHFNLYLKKRHDSFLCCLGPQLIKILVDLLLTLEVFHKLFKKEGSYFYLNTTFYVIRYI